MQMHIITGVSDKLAQQTGSQQIINTLINGVLIPDPRGLPDGQQREPGRGIVFLFFGGFFIAKWGQEDHGYLVLDQHCRGGGYLYSSACFLEDRKA